jgi:nucleotide-binding universal stress UspA family protein
MKILIGYDGSAAADGALRDLESAGLPASAEALVLIAVPPGDTPQALAIDPTGAGWLAGSYPAGAPTPEELEAARETGDHAGRLLRARFPAWKVRVAVPVSDPAQALLEKADAWKADLIVVGSRGWTWLGRALLGSTAEKILAHAKANVRLAAPLPDDRSGPPRLLLAVDGSRDADSALEEILRREWPAGAHVRLLAAEESLPWADAMAEAGEDAPWREAAPGSWAAMERYLAAAESRLQARGLTAEHAILAGDPRKVILAQAETLRVDCIFMGRRGASGFRRLLLGSVSGAVASHAPCSVEVIRHPVRARRAASRTAPAGRESGRVRP